MILGFSLLPKFLFGVRLCDLTVVVVVALVGVMVENSRLFFSVWSGDKFEEFLAEDRSVRQPSPTKSYHFFLEDISVRVGFERK